MRSILLPSTMKDDPNIIEGAASPPTVPPPDAQQVLGYRNIVDDRRPVPWLDLLGLMVSVGAILFFLPAVLLMSLLILRNDWTYDPWTELFFFVLCVICLYLSCLCALSYSGWVLYGRPRSDD